MKPLGIVAIVISLALALYFLFFNLQYFSDTTYLAGFLLLEVIVICLWKYDQRFFSLLMIAFLWAGMHVPVESAWTTARWVVLAAGAAAGFIVWTKSPRGPFSSLHLIAFFCIGAAFVSASVSPFVRMASLKALSLLLLFLYCATGGRLAVLRREQHFFRGLLLACEILVYGSAICYLGFGIPIWGNPNSLGASMGVGVFPILLWGWFIADEPGVKLRRFLVLLLCAYLSLFSGARAGMASMAIVTLTLSFCLRQYKLLVKSLAVVLVMVALNGMFAPENLGQRLGNLKDLVLYKGHENEGMLGSRRTPWEKTINSIKAHPWFGTGYGTSPTGEDPGTDFGVVRSSAETTRENGSSYMTITEWVGLLGGLPFVALLGITVMNLWRVCVWMKRTRDPRHYSIPVAMVVLAGLVHAGFEDWLFAVGYYLCVYFWICAFLLVDLLPDAVVAPVAGVYPRMYRPSPAGFGAVLPNR